MLLSNRTIFSDNATLKDLSVAVNNFKSENSALPVVAAEDYLFIGSELPFNHRWVEMGVDNDAVSKLKIEIWEGDEWVEAVDVIDQTALGGASLGRSGYISWTVDKDNSWDKEDTQDSNDLEDIEGLGDVKIFDMYWARFSWDSDLNALTEVKHIGQKFSGLDDMAVVYPDLITANAMKQFKVGTVDWKDQEFLAAEDVVRHLISSKIIKNSNQILDWHLFTRASVYKVAEIIFQSYGSDWDDERRAAAKSFKTHMDNEIYRIDKNKNARLDHKERFNTVGILKR